MQYKPNASRQRFNLSCPETAAKDLPKASTQLDTRKGRVCSPPGAQDCKNPSYDEKYSHSESIAGTLLREGWCHHCVAWRDAKPCPCSPALSSHGTTLASVLRKHHYSSRSNLMVLNLGAGCKTSSLEWWGCWEGGVALVCLWFDGGCLFFFFF